MEWKGLNDLREQYLSFFESKNHTRMASASLIPQGDKSLLLINSGMAPLKKFFLGQAVPPNVRVTTCQKCIRTPDIENVGKTARHGTYFEMLGNFSFGDYFKWEAIQWAWEFFTEVLKMPKELLHCSVFENDDEAYTIWTQEIGVEESHMVRMGREDNFWEHGTGPCGPCSEIYFDRGAEKGCGRPDCHVGCECDRYVEVWNLVFSQFDSDGNGNYTEMEHKNIDTGMGLERLACVMQGVDNLFEVDTVQNIMQHISRIANVKYHENHDTDVSLRVITDHIRSTTFMIGDGVQPSNEGRGYVLRRLLRRAARHGRMIGIKGTFLHEVCDTVIDENKCAYPELEEKRNYIKKIIQVEEEAFAKTIDKGMELLTEIMEQSDSKILSGEDVFKLSDTYGFPFDLTVEIAAEKNFTVDEDGYRALVKKQRDTAKADHAAKASSSWADNSLKLDLPKTAFKGYQENEIPVKILAILKDQAMTDSVTEQEKAVLVLDQTVLYAESGGQASDHGKIFQGDDAIFRVESVSKDEDGHYLHVGYMKKGTLHVNDLATAKYCTKFRNCVMRNHTAAHLLQAALREVLGDHVHQAGQLVNDKACRFDFSHFSALTSEEIRKVESLVNTWILNAISVDVREMPIEEARKLGAMALFGEKYGDVVRVVSAGEVSVEFCGGTHVANTANIGLFRIVSESSVASGVRRIEAVTGEGILELLNQLQNTLQESAKALKINHYAELPARCTALTAQLKESEKTIDSLRQKMAGSAIDAILKQAKPCSQVQIVSAKIENAGADMLRNMGDQIRNKAVETGLIAVLAGVNGDKNQLYCVCTKQAVAKGAHAGKIVQKLAAITGGKGGGRPDQAMAGIGKPELLDTAFAALEQTVSELIK
ncbi:MAG: alanine--tRNA ligase [Oscillospiraceae bacterium]|nr:alanine--tRNA ligase [Oscillospiraceae bacterium]